MRTRPMRGRRSLVRGSFVAGGIVAALLITTIPAAAVEAPTSYTAAVGQGASAVTQTWSGTGATTVPGTAAVLGGSLTRWGSEISPAPAVGTNFSLAVPSTQQATRVLTGFGPCTAATGSCPDLGTLTVTFSQPVMNPTIHVANIGANTTAAGSPPRITISHSLLQLTTPGVTLEKRAGHNLDVVGGTTVRPIRQDTNTVCGVGAPPGDNTDIGIAECGSFLARTTAPVTSISFSISAFHMAYPFANAVAVPLANLQAGSDEYFVVATLAEDFGDAPASYNAGNAARHIIGGLRFGSGVTEDNADVVNSATSPNAGAGANGDADDALANPLTISKTATSFSYTLPVSGVAKTAYASGWIDFNGNGAFDAGERATTTVPAGASSVTLSWTGVTVSTTAATTYARFRIGYSNIQAIAPTGPSNSGEVEDYAVTVQGPVGSITVKKADYRVNANNQGGSPSPMGAKYAVGARFALFSAFEASVAPEPIGGASNPTYTCEITALTNGGAAPSQCVIDSVPVGGYWVGEIEPAPGTPAAEHYSEIITDFGYPGFSEYRYSATASSAQNSTVPTASTANRFPLWARDISAGAFANRLKNPELTASCEVGANVAIILDVSSSTESFKNELAAAASTIVSGLEGTPSKVAFFSFAALSPASNVTGLTNHPTLTSVQTSAQAAAVKQWWSAPGNLNQASWASNPSAPPTSHATNWDAGLWRASEHNGQGSNPAETYDAVFFITDGVPTLSNAVASSATVASALGDGFAWTFREQEWGVLSANVLKDQGSRVLGVGVNMVPDDGSLVSSVSGTQWFDKGDPQTSVNDIDAVLASTQSSDLSNTVELLSSMVVDCDSPTLRLVKQVDNAHGGTAEPEDFTLTATPTDPAGPALEFISGETKDVTVGEWTIGEQSRAGYELTGIGCSTDGGAVVDLSDGALTVGSGDREIVCALSNRALPGTASWQKVDQSSPAQHLGGSEWRLNGPGGRVVTVADCAVESSDPCPAGSNDTDKRKGHFSVTDLGWGSWTVIETKAPAGYRLDSTPHAFTISATGLTHQFADPFVNEQQSIPAIPLTGGLGEHLFLVGGGVLLAGLLALLAIRGWRRRDADRAHPAGTIASS